MSVLYIDAWLNTFTSKTALPHSHTYMSQIFAILIFHSPAGQVVLTGLYYWILPSQKSICICLSLKCIVPHKRISAGRQPICREGGRGVEKKQQRYNQAIRIINTSFSRLLEQRPTYTPLLTWMDLVSLPKPISSKSGISWFVMSINFPLSRSESNSVMKDSIKF